MARHDDNEHESLMGPIGAAAAVLVTFGFLVWLVASNRIVYGTLQPALFFGAMWKWIPSDFTYSQWNEVVRMVQAYAPRPNDVSVVQWLALLMVAFRPLLLVLMTLYLLSLVFLVRKRQILTRRFDADRLMLHTMRHFSGVAPVVAIRERIAKNLHPLWRRQVAPEEVFLQWRVPKGAPAMAPAGAPMVRDGKFDRDVARAYFQGLWQPTSNGPSGLQSSVMLGRQVVNLLEDSKRAAGLVFADRMSAEGKTLLALWTAVAFGEKQGREEFCHYRDLLNRSAYGTPDGKANLALAQPLYDKYRKHPMLAKVFAMHHWEHTMLFFLLSLAQKKGRFTTAEVLWLRPTNRVMYFALNSRGSYTPHTEAAATYAQFQYEAACAKAGRLPLARLPDGRLAHMIYVEKAVDGLELEYGRWAEGTDDDDSWWQRSDIWTRSNNVLVNHFKQVAAAVPVAEMPGADSAPTAFDKATSAQAEEKAVAEERRAQDELARAFGAGGTSAL